MNQDSASMAPPVNKPGQPPDVTVLTVSREIDVTPVQKGSKEMNVMSVVRGSREMDARNAHRTTTGIIVVMVCQNSLSK